MTIEEFLELMPNKTAFRLYFEEVVIPLRTRNVFKFADPLEFLGKEVIEMLLKKLNELKDTSPLWEILNARLNEASRNISLQNADETPVQTIRQGDEKTTRVAIDITDLIPAKLEVVKHLSSAGDYQLHTGFYTPDHQLKKSVVIIKFYKGAREEFEDACKIIKDFYSLPDASGYLVPLVGICDKENSIVFEPASYDVSLGNLLSAVDPGPNQILPPKVFRLRIMLDMTRTICALNASGEKRKKLGWGAVLDLILDCRPGNFFLINGWEKIWKQLLLGNNLVAKYGNFGYGQALQAGNYSCGNPNQKDITRIPPGRDSEETRMKNADRWSLGCALFSLWIWVHWEKFTSEDRERIIVKRLKPKDNPILAKIYTSKWMAQPIDGGAPPALYELVQTGCWQLDPKNRPDLETICDVVMREFVVAMGEFLFKEENPEESIRSFLVGCGDFLNKTLKSEYQKMSDNLSIVFPNDEKQYENEISILKNKNEVPAVLIIYSVKLKCWKAYLQKPFADELVEVEIQQNSEYGKILYSCMDAKAVSNKVEALRELIKTESLFSGFPQSHLDVLMEMAVAANHSVAVSLFKIWKSILSTEYKRETSETLYMGSRLNQDQTVGKSKRPPIYTFFAEPIRAPKNLLRLMLTYTQDEGCPSNYLPEKLGKAEYRKRMLDETLERNKITDYIKEFAALPEIERNKKVAAYKEHKDAKDCPIHSDCILKGAAQILKSFGVAESLFQCVQVGPDLSKNAPEGCRKDDWLLKPFITKALENVTTEKYLMFVIPTNNLRHAVKVVLDIHRKTFHCMDSEVDRNHGQTEAIIKLKEFKGYNIITPPQKIANNPQQPIGNNVDCGSLAAWNGPRIIAGLENIIPYSPTLNRLGISPIVDVATGLGLQPITAAVSDNLRGGLIMAYEDYNKLNQPQNVHVPNNNVKELKV